MYTLLLSLLLIGSPDSTDISVSIPVGGNSFITSSAKGAKERVTDSGWVNWTDPKTVFSTFVKVRHGGTLNVFATIGVPKGKSSIYCVVNDEGMVVNAEGNDAKEYEVGSWTIADSGYVRIDMKGVRKTGPVFGEVRELRLSGTAIDNNTAYVKNNDGNFFYWGRRGPSVHMNYDAAEISRDAEWFYSEVTVPEGNDVVGSFFMPNGFAEGYFGIQVNSPTERRVLFSVWSPYKTDDAAAVPESMKVKLVKAGAGVRTGEFGSEGSGGQSYLVYPWKVNTTYRFLTHAQQTDTGYTIFTSYFYTPETKQWNLIASFGRPATKTYLMRIHAFLENFEPENGWITRTAYFSNPWVRDRGGNWRSMGMLMFTGDATAQKGYRLDYDGGVEGDKFFLKNCGFFQKQTILRSIFFRMNFSHEPEINFGSLEK